MWNEILETLLAYVASYTNNQQDVTVGTSSSHDDSNDDSAAMSAADEHAFLVAAKLLDEEHEDNLDEENKDKEDNERPENNTHGEDDMTAFEEFAFLTQWLNHEDDKTTEGHPTNDWSNQDNDMTAAEEEEFLIAAKLLKKTKQHASMAVAAESLEDPPMQGDAPSKRKRGRNGIEKIVRAKRRRLQFQSVTVYSFPDDLGGSSMSNDGFSLGMTLQHCSQETFDLSKITDDPEGDRKETASLELTPNDRRDNLFTPSVRYVGLEERLNRLARAGVTVAEMEAHRNEVEKIRGYGAMKKINGLTKQHVQAIFQKVKDWIKKRDRRMRSTHIKSNDDACFREAAAENGDKGKKRAAMATPAKSILNVDACFREAAAENGDKSKKRAAMATPGKSILKRRKVQVHSRPSMYL